MDLARSPAKEAWGLDLEGVLKELAIDVTAEEGDVQKAEGTVLLRGENLVLKGGQVGQEDFFGRVQTG